MPSIYSFFCRLYLKRLKTATNPAASVKERRASAEKRARLAKMPARVAVEKVTVANTRAEWLQPAKAIPEKVMLYLHGGGFVTGSCNTHRALTAHIAQASGVRALLLAYRLAPEHPFPAALKDSMAAYHWLLQNGIQSHNVVVAGDSAGGGLTLSTLISLRDEGHPLPAAAVCISPIVDLEGTGESVKTRARTDPWLVPQAVYPPLADYIGDQDLRLPLLSPIHADLHELSPMLIHVGSDEILLSDSTRLEERARAAGVEVTLEIWPGMWHVFHGFAPRLPEARRAIEKIGVFIRNHIY